jgi:hypothetical protein
MYLAEPGFSHRQLYVAMTNKKCQSYQNVLAQKTRQEPIIGYAMAQVQTRILTWDFPL